MLLRKTPVALALVSLLGPAWAQSSSPAPAPSAEPTQALSELTVSATRTERATDSVPNTVTVIGTEALKRRPPKDLKALLDDEVDLAVRTQAMRFTTAGSSAGRAGNEGLNVRGLEGNQVAMMVDGIRLPLSWSFGPFASSRGDYFEIDSLATAEVLRGPASAQFGSDGLAGALSLNTLSPSDLLKGGKTLAGLVSTGYDSADESWKASGGVAAASGDWQGLLLLTRRQGHETENQGEVGGAGANRTQPNPLTYTRDNLLAKANLKLNAQHQLLATLEAHQLKRDIDVQSGLSSTITAMDGEDRVERQRFSLEHRYDDLNAEWLQSLRTTVYAQQARTRESTFEDATTDRSRSTFYREKVLGLSTQAQTQLPGQRLSYGLDISRREIDGLRDGTPAGTSFPSKYFPDTTYTQTGAFVQDEIEAGAFSLIPGLRFEQYSLKPDTDGYSGPAPVSLSDQAVTPRLGAVWRLSDAVQPYAQWALGFRAPTPDQVNGNYSSTNGAYYRTIGNSQLNPEHANSLEVGLRGRVGSSLQWQLSAYNNRYRDFISMETVGGSITSPTNPQTFQYINLAKARIKGVEARAVWQATQDLKLNASVAHASGQSIRNGVSTPLDTVQPTRAKLGALYTWGDWDLQAAVQHSAAKKASEISTASYFATPSYQLLDLAASWRLTPTLSLSAAVNNVTDKKYWRWSDVRGVAANSSALDAYTAPGRSVSLALRAEF